MLHDQKAAYPYRVVQTVNGLQTTKNLGFLNEGELEYVRRTQEIVLTEEQEVRVFGRAVEDEKQEAVEETDTPPAPKSMFHKKRKIAKQSGRAVTLPAWYAHAMSV